MAGRRLEDTLPAYGSRHLGDDIRAVEIVLVQLTFVLTFLFGLNLLSLNLGPLSPVSSRLLAILCLLFGWSVTLSNRRASLAFSLDRLLAAGVAVASLCLMLMSEQRGIWLACLSLNAGSLWVLMRDRESEAARAVSACFIASLLYLLGFLVVQNVPTTWCGLQSIVKLVSQDFSRRAGTGVVQSASTGGVYVTAAAFLYLLARAMLSHVRRWYLLAWGALVLTILLGIHLAAAPLLAVKLARYAGEGFTTLAIPGSVHGVQNALAAVYSPILALGWTALIVIVFEPFWRPRQRELPLAFPERQPLPDDRGPERSGLSASSSLRGHRLRHYVPGIASLLGFAALIVPAYRIPAAAGHEGVRGKRVLFYRDADENLRQFNEPTFERFGLIEAGMFGMLTRYLEAWGYVAPLKEADQPLDAATLAGTDVLVVINLTRRLTEAEHDALWRWIEAGGALLVLGDHTDIGGSMEPLNRMLEPAGIGFNFDSAFTATHWVNAYEVFPHPITTGLDSVNEQMRHSTGASLSLKGKARPVVSARWAFSDRGDRKNVKDAYLGDYGYQFDEPLSDAVIIAEASHGSGKVLVFGDTSAYQNVAIAHSQGFLRGVFRHLALDSPRSPLFGWVGLTLLAIAAVLLVWQLDQFRSSAMSGAAVLVAAMACLWLQPRLNSVTPAPVVPVVSACLDAAHANGFSLASWRDDSVDGLLVNLARNGFLPQVLLDRREFRSLPAGGVLVVITPAVPYSEEELRCVREFMEQGGLLILSVGAEEKAGATGLLSLVDVDISDMPLGPIPIEPPQPSRSGLPQILSQPHFREAWPIVNRGAEPLRPFYQQAGYDVIGYRPVGRGGALIIADSWYLHDKILEAEKAWWPGNIELLRSILSTVRAPREGT